MLNIASPSYQIAVKNTVLLALSVSGPERSTAEAFVVPCWTLSQKSLTGDNVLIRMATYKVKKHSSIAHKIGSR